MNKKQEILDCIKTLNLTQEQANRLADVLASGGEGGSNKSVKMFSEWWDGNLETFKINDKEIPYTERNNPDLTRSYLITEQDFNYIANAIKNCTEFYMEILDETQYLNERYGVNVMYASYDNTAGYIVNTVRDIPSFNLLSIFKLIKTDSEYYFKMGD